MNTARATTTMALDVSPWMPGLHVRLKDDTEYAVHHLDHRTCSLFGSAVPVREIVPVTFVVSQALSVTAFARAGESTAHVQSFQFVDADPDVIDLVLSLIPLETVQ